MKEADRLRKARNLARYNDRRVASALLGGRYLLALRHRHRQLRAFALLAEHAVTKSICR